MQTCRSFLYPDSICIETLRDTPQENIFPSRRLIQCLLSHRAMRLLLFLSTLFSALPLSISDTTAAPRLIHDSDAMQVKVYQLDNGFTVYLSRNTEAPRLYAEIAVRAGSLTDPSDSTGLAHYLEHLMFKGTRKMGTLDYEKEKPHIEKITALYEQHSHEQDAEKRKTIYQEINKVSTTAAQYAVANDIDRIYKLIGGLNVNAHTYYEETVYKVDIPSNQLERWAKIEAERFSDPVFRLFHTELEAVYEEKNTSLDSGQDRLYESVDQLLFPGHPYGSQTVLGKAEHLKTPSLVTIREYFDKYYVPGNMAIFISGDIVLDQTIHLIDQHFGKIPAKPVPQSKATPPAPIKDVSRAVVTHEGETSLLMAWRTVANSHKDNYALQMLDMILDNSVAGLINLNLVNPQLVKSAGSYPNLLNEAGAQYLWGSPREGQSLEDVEALLIQQIEQIKQGKFDDWLLPAIVSDLQTDIEESYESNENRVAMIRESYIERRSWEDASQYITHMSAVTREDVIRVANKYFGKNYVVGHLVKGKPTLTHIEKPQIDAVPLNSSSESAFSKSIMAMDTQPTKPYFIKAGKDYHQSGSKDQVQHFTTFNPVNNLFDITWTFPKGSIHDDLLMTAFSLLEKSGTKNHSSIELEKLWYQLGVNADFSVYEHHTEITLSGLSSSHESATQLLYQWIDEMNVEQSVLDKLISDTKLAREDSADDPDTIIHAMARYNRYGDKSKYVARQSSATLEKVTVAQLQKMIHQLFSLPHQASYIGQLSESQWRKITPEFKVTNKTPASINRPITQIRSPLEISFYHRDMAQAQIWIESELTQLSTDDIVMIKVFNEYFDGGMSGIIFQEIREARGLAYSASGYLSWPRWEQDAYLAVGKAACQADKVDEALTKFLQLFDQLPQSEVRFTETKDALLNRIRAERLGFRSRVYTTQSWQRSGVHFNTNERGFKEIPEISLPKLLDFHTKKIKGKPKRICILGDRSQIDFEALKKLGPIKELKAEDIFTP